MEEKMRWSWVARGFVVGIFAFAASALNTVTAESSSGAAASFTERVLYNFCSQGGSSCTDGYNPVAGVLMDGVGNLYGTTSGTGINNNYGAVFRLAPSSSGGTETVLYSFCLQNGCPDGRSPRAGLLMDGAGNLYGTTIYGGARDSGTVFKLAASGTGRAETGFYNFCSQSSCTDGVQPVAGLLMDGSGNLYGTTSANSVYKLAPSGTGWTETVIYKFCSQSGCSDGSTPQAGLIMDGTGSLYGTTSRGRKYGFGTV